MSKLFTTPISDLVRLYNLNIDEVKQLRSELIRETASIKPKIQNEIGPVVVPNIVGLKIYEAEEKLKKDGLLLGRIRYLENVKRDDELVMAQLPTESSGTSSGYFSVLAIPRSHLLL